MTKKKVTKKETEKPEKNYLYVGEKGEYRGNLVAHKIIRSYFGGDNGEVKGSIEHRADRNFEFMSIHLGAIKKGKPITVRQAVGELITLGYWPIEDLEKFLPEKTIDEMAKKLAKKYDLNLK